MTQRARRFVVVVGITAVICATAIVQSQQSPVPAPTPAEQSTHTASPATDALAQLPIKGRAPKTGYSRDQFGNGWAQVGGCDMRNLVLRRDLASPHIGEDGCAVLSGTLADPYTSQSIQFQRGPGTSDDVQIDHVVALSDAWQKGAQQLPPEQRQAFANDDLNLLAVHGPTNQKKGDGDAATWLPPNKDYRCPYVARQIAVKHKYTLWVTQAEHDAIVQILQNCPGQPLPIIKS